MSLDKNTTCEKCIFAENLLLLSSQLQILNNHRYLRRLDSTYRLLWWNFVQGIFRGLGAAIGATVVVTMTASILAALDWLPFLGKWLDLISLELDLPKN